MQQDKGFGLVLPFNNSQVQNYSKPPLAIFVGLHALNYSMGGINTSTVMIFLSMFNYKIFLLK